jgi:hypothetical protein
MPGRLGWSVVRRPLAAMGIACLLTAGCADDGEPEGTPVRSVDASAFVGEWASTDADGSSQTMTIHATAEGTYEWVLHDDMTGPCNGPSTDTGIGRLDGANGVVVSSIKTTCENGREPDGTGDSLIFVHDAETDTLIDNVGVVWSRT